MNLLRYELDVGHEIFLTPKRFEPRLPFSYKSKYGTSGIFEKKNQIFLSTGLPDI